MAIERVGDKPVVPADTQAETNDVAENPPVVPTGTGVVPNEAAAEFVPGLPPPTPMNEGTSSPSGPVHGARGRGRARGPRGRDVVAPGARGQARGVPSGTYFAHHGRERLGARGILQNAQFVAPAERQTWDSLVRQVYGDRLHGASPETLALLAEAVAHLNGVSNFEAPPTSVAMPELADLTRFLAAMRNELQNQPTTPIVRPAVTQFGGANPPRSDLPTAGHAYRARWNDTLRGLALHAYRAELAGLSPREADARLQQIMLAIARTNGLNTTHLRDAGEIWLPTSGQLRAVLGELEDPAVSRALREAHPRLWRSIERYGRDAQRDLQFSEGRDVQPATATADLAGRVAQAQASVRFARVLQAMDGPSGGNVFGMFNFNWWSELYIEEPPPPGELPIRRPDEPLEAYLDRVDPNLPPELYSMILDRPAMVMMLAAGIMNSNGDIDPGRQAEFDSAMQRLGLVDAEGRWDVQARPDETFKAAVDRTTFEALRRIGISVPEGQSLEEVVRGASPNATPEQQGLMRQLVIWNQLVELSHDPTVGGTGSGGGSETLGQTVSGSVSDFWSPPFWGFAGYSGKQKDCFCDELLKGSLEEGLLDNEAVEEEPTENDSDEERRSAARNTEDALASHESRRRSGRVDVHSESVLAERRDAQHVDRVIERNLRHAEDVTLEQHDATQAINQALADGRPVGGPPPRRG